MGCVIELTFSPQPLKSAELREEKAIKLQIYVFELIRSLRTCIFFGGDVMGLEKLLIHVF